MAVFTEISSGDVDELLSQYDIGKEKALKGITSGIENSNFYLDTAKGRYVLTVFERLNKDQLPYYLELTSHLGKKGLSVSYPIPRKDGGLLSEIAGKPCSIAPCLPGVYIEKPSAEICREMGSMLARMHNAVKDFPMEQENMKGAGFWVSSLPLLKPYIPERLYEMLEKEVNHQIELQKTDAYKNLPSGAVHADLFRNNALIDEKAPEGQKIGVIDFYFACNAPFLYDLAVTLNDWAVDLETGEFEEDKARAMMEGYNAVRPLTEQDKALWQDMLSAAALRFWVSRLYDYYLPRPASLLKPHDPAHFERILNLRRNAPASALPWI